MFANICSVYIPKQHQPAGSASNLFCVWHEFKMKSTTNYQAFYKIFILLPLVNAIRASNLECYQCIRNTSTECSPAELLPCPSVSDRCVTHISKDAEKGFSIKRECGLGPCGFQDDMANRGLGLDNCDRSRNEYFCIFCCKESGCNKNGASYHNSVKILLLFAIVFVNIFRNFQEPYHVPSQ